MDHSEEAVGELIIAGRLRTPVIAARQPIPVHSLGEPCWQIRRGQVINSGEEHSQRSGTRSPCDIRPLRSTVGAPPPLIGRLVTDEGRNFWHRRARASPRQSRRPSRRREPDGPLDAPA